MYLQVIGGQLTVKSILEGSPASHVDLRAGDVILSIDGENCTYGVTVEWSTGRIRGPIGVPVTLIITRLGRTTPVVLTVTRASLAPSIASTPGTPSTGAALGPRAYTFSATDASIVDRWRQDWSQRLAAVGSPLAGELAAISDEFSTTQEKEAIRARVAAAAASAREPVEAELAKTSFTADIPVKLTRYHADGGCFGMNQAGRPDWESGESREIPGLDVRARGAWPGTTRGSCGMDRPMMPGRHSYVSLAWLCVPVDQARALRAASDAGSLYLHVVLRPPPPGESVYNNYWSMTCDLGGFSDGS